MQAINWDEDSLGMCSEYIDIPADLREDCAAWREKMVEAAAEASDELMEKYLEGQALSEEEIYAGLRARTLKGEIVLAMCGSAFKNKGVQAMLDAVIRYLPSPLDKLPVKGILDDAAESEGERQADDDAPFAALAFKIATDPFVGTLTFVRCYSGVVNSGRYGLQPGSKPPRAHRPDRRCTPTVAKRSEKFVLATLPPASA